MRSPKAFGLSTAFFATAIAAYACWLAINWGKAAYLTGLVTYGLLSALCCFWPLDRSPTSWRWSFRFIFVLHLAFAFSVGPALRYVAIVNRPPIHDIELKRRFVNIYDPLLDCVLSSPDSDSSTSSAYLQWWMPNDVQLQFENDTGIIGRYRKPNGKLSSKYLYWCDRRSDG